MGQMRIFMAIFMVFFVLIFVGGLIFNFIIFKDCTDRGNALYQCAAAMNNGHYVAVEEMGSEE